jgi:pimeloyl-ACP methyl ester carboxylesterase
VPDRSLALTERAPGDGGEGPLVVLVHGSLDRGSSFLRVMRRLDDLPTVAYDRRGYQGSRHLPVAAGLDDHVEDLLAVVGGRPAVVVGHSFGGVVALAAALRAGGPGPVTGVAVYEPPLPWAGPDARRPPRVGGVPDPLADPEPALAAERFFRRMVGDAAWERLPAEGRASRHADGPALVADLRAARAAEAPFDPARLTVPLVVGRGTASPAHLRSAAGWLAGTVDGSELVELDGAGHGAHLTHPDAFAALVRTAVARTRPAGGPPCTS